MSTYNSYAEAKIMNPESEIYHLSNIEFVSADTTVRAGDWEKCDPADYCMTVEKFLADGHKFIDSDIVWHRDESVEVVKNPDLWNRKSTDYDDEDQLSYVLRAAALLKPQFHNGDTVYDENGNTMMYATVHPLLPETSVLLNSLGELTAIRTNKLTTKPPVTPKDGEWWMCELTDENLEITHMFNNVLLYTNDGWVGNHDCLEIKPLYRMIRDTDTDTE